MTTTGGLLAYEDGAGIDFTALRLDRRERVLTEMESEGIDALLVGRRPNAKFLVGHRPFWRAVLTPFAPMAVLVGSTRALTILGATWDDGIPPEIGRDAMVGLSWDPASFGTALASVPGLADASRIGADGMSPWVSQLLKSVSPDAEIVDGTRVLATARRTKSRAELDCIEIALAIAEGALERVRSSCVPGMLESDLKAQFMSAIASYGTTLPAYEPICCVSPVRETSTARLPIRRRSERVALREGDLVMLSGGVLYGGYEGSISRTVVCSTNSATPLAPQQALADRWQRSIRPVVDACTVGATEEDLRSAWTKSGEPAPPVPIISGIGVGLESPTIRVDVPNPDGASTSVLHAGMVVNVESYVWEPEIGGFLGSETVHISAEGPRILTRYRQDDRLIQG